jgi:hypothetical protein
MKKTVIRLSAVLGLVLTLLPALLVFAGYISFDTHKGLMIVGMVLWFGAVSRREFLL